MLTFDGLSLRLGDFRLTADLSVPKGARVAIIGPSGAGKSTLLAALGGFLAPDSGRILWDGQDIGALPPGGRPLTTVFQDANLFPHLTAEQNVALGLKPSLRLSAAEQGQVRDALSKVGLQGLGRRLPRDLSGGQQGRVALARALLRARPILALDEAFAALGPALRAEMLALTRSVVDGTGATLLMITHDPQEARAVSDLAILVADGVAHAPVPTQALLADPPEALKRYLGPG